MESEPVEPELLASTLVRISDAERDQVIRQLQTATSDGRIDLSEFEERTRQVYAARYQTDLAPITADLPTSAGTAIATPQTKPGRRWLVQVLGGQSRKGNWDPGDQLVSLTLLGGQVLDLTDVAATEVDIIAITLMGPTVVIVPAGASVDVSGFRLMGGTNNATTASGSSPMRVRLRSFGAMGGCSVRNLTPKEEAKRATYRGTA